MSRAGVVMLPRPPLTPEDRSRLVLERYARIGKTGKPQICVDRNSGITKVTFANAANAQAAAEQLTRIFGVQQYTYPCPQSRKGHHHLTTSPPRTPAAKENAPCSTPPEASA